MSQKWSWRCPVESQIQEQLVESKSSLLTMFFVRSIDAFQPLGDREIQIMKLGLEEMANE